MLNANDWEQLSDDDFAAQRVLCEKEHDRRECAKLAPEVAKVHLEIRPTVLKRERLHAGRSLKRRQFDYCRGVSVAIYGRDIGQYAFALGGWDNRTYGSGYSSTVAASSYANANNAIVRRERYFSDGFRRPEPRFERLLLLRVKAEIDAIEGQLIAEGKPMQWVGYEDESPVPAGMEKGKAK